MIDDNHCSVCLSQFPAAQSRSLHRPRYVMPAAPRLRLDLATLTRAAAICLVATLSLVAAAPGFAQTYPNRPIRLTVGFPPGGNADLAARAIANKLSRTLNTTIVVDNRTGAGGAVAVQIVAAAAADGYTLLWASPGALTIAPILEKNLSYNAEKAFQPIGLAFTFGNVLVARQEVPINTVAQFIAAAKEQPARLNVASQGVASAGHLSLELFLLMTGVRVTHVPYKGAGAIVPAMLGGELPYAFISTTIARAQRPRIKSIAVTTLARDAALPDVPTMDESGIKGYDASFWFGMLAPAGTSPAIRDLLNKHLRAALADDEAMKIMHTQGLNRLASTPDEFAQRMRSDSVKWKKALGAV
jgi:tripartite-type tricarboxylate transporter receptor subunit TctC